MADFTTKDIRNIVLVRHGGCGKTTLAEAMLFKTGIINKMSTVDEGGTVGDFNPDEKERKISIDLAVLHCEHKGAKINILDAPGYPDFVGAAVSGMAAAETVVIVVNAAAGIEPNTRNMWGLAGKMGLGRAIVINRMDSDTADAARLLGELQENFGRQCIPANLPVGQGAAFEGVESTITPSGSPQQTTGGSVAETSEKLIEAVVEVDETMMEKYLEEGATSAEAIIETIPAAIAGGSLVPVFFSAAPNATGVTELLDAIVNCFPSPLQGLKRNLAAVSEDAEPKPLNPNGTDLVGRVFRAKVDPFVGKLSFIRVHSGTLTSEGSVLNERTGKTEKTQNLFIIQGKDTENLSRLVSGDIGALAKVESLSVNDTICSAEKPAKLEEIKFPKPMVALAIEPKSRKDEQKISESLNKLSEEDRTFSVERDRQTKELVVRGTSQFHLDLMLARLKSRFEVEVTAKLPKIAYLETVTTKAEGHYRHKKQTGGRGQFGECYVRIEPLPRGEGFQFVNSVFGGAIPSNFIPAVEKGVREQLEKGVIAGHQFVDVKLELYDGSFHNVDSDEISFKICGARAFQDAAVKAKPVLLEPIVNIEVTVPAKFMGDISGDLSSKRGRIVGMDSVGNLQVIKAKVPMSEIGRYSTELRSITGGEGSHTIEFSHYDIVPGRLAEEIVAKAKRPAEE